MTPALYASRQEGDTVRCELCPRGCVIRPGKAGYCLARRNLDGILYAESYGVVTALALDPIEKKPLREYHPGSRILSVGSYGCTMSCPFCQNHEIAARRAQGRLISPEELAATSLEAVSAGNIGVAYTYNEPLAGYEYVLDCARLIRKQGQKNVLVTNGMIEKAPLLELIPLLDAANVDLKCYDAEQYQRLGGSLDTVLESIALLSKSCHVEVTSLIVPGISDGEAQMDALARRLAGINRKIPLHITRFFPRHKMTDTPPTPISDIHKLAEIAKIQLDSVYKGNC